MSDFLELVKVANTPLTAILCWLVWKIYSNDLPHIREEIAKLQAGKRNKR